MSAVPTSSKANTGDDFEDEDIFDDSIFLDNFGNSSFKKNKQLNSRINDSANRSGLNVSALCCDEEISGYDKLTGKTWIYPTNYPVRDYQFNIIKATILKNTLVSLPTGLGKTFIAAVIMYNFYRWYPVGKIVFTAPTRPLIAQQIEACYNINAIPPSDTIEMTGHMQANTRKSHWINKRVFFATPQVIYNDIKSGICPGDKIRCLVIDEAHRARKNYAYCQIVSCLDDIGHKTYRLLALSATPGSKVEDVVSVINSLHIAHLELRTEECLDVAPYSYSRKINTVIVQLGPELAQLRQNYLEILDVYARRLKQLNILPQNLGNLSKGRVVMLYKEFQSKDRGSRHPQHNYIMKDFTILIALYHGLELLLRHGSRVFLNFFDEHPEKSWIQADDKLTMLLERLRDDLGINPMSLNTSILPDGTIPEIPKNIRFGHPKFDKLKEIMMEHFTAAKKKGLDTRAIVFCEYRESVNLVHCLLLQCRPLITPQTFVGQGASGKDGKTMVSQKQQLRVMSAFRSGACNTLVATCVAEEGLDVGAVDLILCFDISTRSPIRLVQRCGRTGRERSGQVHILVTEGREHQTLMDCMRQRDGLNKKILQSKEVENSLYKLNPRMIPHDFMPTCEKMFITVAKKNDVKTKGANDTKGQKDLRTMLLDRGASSATKSKGEASEPNFLNETEFNELFPEGYVETNYLQTSKEYFSMDKDAMKMTQADKGQLKLFTWLEWQRNTQKTISVNHSKDSDILIELLRLSDTKRFEMQSLTQQQSLTSPMKPSQNPVASSPAKPIFPSSVSPSKTIPIMFPSPKKTKVLKKKQKCDAKSPAKNNGDIRALFSTTTKSMKNYTKLITDLGIPNDGSIPTSIINLLVDLNLDNSSKKCYICDNVCTCSLITNIKSNKAEPLIHSQFLIDPQLPDINLIQGLDVASILKCNNKNEDTNNLSEADLDGNNNFDLDFDIESTIESSPKDLVTHTNDINATTNFDIGDIDDIFNNTPPEAADASEENVEEDKAEGETLKFFGLNSIEDIFADYDDSSDFVTDDKNTKVENKITNATKSYNSPKPERPPITDVIEQPLSPSILSGQIRNTKTVTSPILCSQSRRLQLNTTKIQASVSTPKAKKRLTLEQTDNSCNMPEEIEVTKTSLVKTCQRDISDKSMLTITQLVEMVNKSDRFDTSAKSRKDPSPEQKIRERSVSPILLTQADKKKTFSANSKSIRSQGSSKTNESIIILESDSDSNDTVLYDYVNDMEESFPNISNKLNTPSQPSHNKEGMNVDNNIIAVKNKITPTTGKRKLEIDESDNVTNSPYFNKKQKLEKHGNKQLSLQEKILTVLKSDKSSIFKNNFTNLHCTVSQPQSNSQKENCNPQITDDQINKGNSTKNKLEMLQMYRRDNKMHENVRNKVHTLFSNATQQPTPSSKRRIEFNDSDDDFEDKDVKNNYRSPKVTKYNDKVSPTTNHKVRKKKTRKGNSFLDLEAEQSDDSRSDSGDELSDDSVGSIAEFICDENVTHHEDMHAHYIKSVRSPIKVKGGFKIPELPKRFNRADVLSQYVEEDEYEMDSFCVDSHIGLTQVNDVSELELAEIILENRKKSKRNGKVRQITQSNDDSPVIKRRNKNPNRQIHSDSDDSS